MDNGYSLGHKWFQNVFFKNCSPDRPQILIMDSHSSHKKLDMIEMAEEANIIPVALPSHTTSELQPLDKGLFKLFKSYHNRACTEFVGANLGNTINKISWPRVFEDAWYEAMVGNGIKKAFKVNKIYPVDHSAIQKEATESSRGMERPITWEVSIPIGHNAIVDLLKIFNSYGPIIIADGNEVDALSVDKSMPSTSKQLKPDLLSQVLQDAGIDLEIESWTEEVDTIFNPPSVPQKKVSHKSTRALTAHSIWTSAEVIQLKRGQKEEKEKVKLERATKQQAKRLQRQC